MKWCSPHQILPQPKGLSGVSDEAFEQEASPSRGGCREAEQADEAMAKGTPIAEVARSLRVSEVTLHQWRAEYGAVDRDAVQRLKDLEK